MKWILFAAVTMVIVALGCKKHSHSAIPSSGITCNVDGKPTSFNERIWLDTINTGIIINGIADTVSGLPYIQIDVSPAAQMDTGLYVNDSLAMPGQNASFLVYQTASATGAINSLFFHSTDDSLGVNSINGAVISGTFHGTAKTLYFDPNTSSLRDSIITLTDGTFNIRL